MFQTLRNAWKIVDLRKKILFTLLIVLVFRIGSAISVPFVDVEMVKLATESGTSEIMNFLTMMSGGGFSNTSIFALSIQPYINASIIVQLLTVAIPALERWSKEGQAGRKKLSQLTRYSTIGLGLLLGVAYYFMVKNNYNALTTTAMKKGFPAIFAAVVIVLCFTAGSALMMWLGEQINEKGIGNGISILLFAGILSRLPTALMMLWQYFKGGIDLVMNGDARHGVWYIVLSVLIVALFIAMIGFIVLITNAERRIPVQYAKRVVGRKMYGGQSTFIPVKVNMSGVMPIILAVSIVQLPNIIKEMFALKDNWFFNLFAYDSWFYVLLYFVLIIGFAFFYVTIQYDPVEMANNLRKNSGSIPGYRPGDPTSDYIKRVLNKITFIGALFLGIIALFPTLFGMATQVYGLTIGGTSIMIVVSVALETTQQIESQMMMRHYKGFLE